MCVYVCVFVCVCECVCACVCVCVSHHSIVVKLGIKPHSSKPCASISLTSQCGSGLSSCRSAS